MRLGKGVVSAILGVREEVRGTWADGVKGQVQANCSLFSSKTWYSAGVECRLVVRMNSLNLRPGSGIMGRD